MEYSCISADCHIDLSWLPYDLFTSNASAAMKDRMPHVVQEAEGPRWITREGPLGFANGKGGTGAMAIGRKYVAGAEHRPDRMAAAGLFSDGLEGVFRPTTPELRIRDQDPDGIQAEVLYGLLGVGHKMTDREASVELYHIYNEWLADLCAFDRRRFVGLASIPSHSVEAAVAEARHAARLGLGGLDFSPYWGMKPLWHMDWEPRWQVAAEAGLAVHFHTIGAQKIPVPDDTPEASRRANQGLAAGRLPDVRGHLSGSRHPFGRAGAPSGPAHSAGRERHRLDTVRAGPHGLGVRGALQGTHSAEDEAQRILAAAMPRHLPGRCAGTEAAGCAGRGKRHVGFRPDYTHADGVWPDSQEYIRRQFSHLPAGVKRRITCENVGRFYGLIK